MRKKIIRCVEAKTLAELKKNRSNYYYRSYSYAKNGSSYVYYGFANCKDDSVEHVQSLKQIVAKELELVGWGAPTTLPMTVCKIKPQQSKTHAHMTMIKVMVPNEQIVGCFSRKHIEL